MSHLPRPALLASLAAGLVALSLTSAAHAGSSCSKDADCGAGFHCELAPTAVAGCASSDGTPCTPPPQSEPSTGFCRETPIACSSDAQCPDYLACVAENTGDVTCSAPACAPGETCPEPTCDSPPPSSDAKLCAPKMIACDSDSACPTGFACNLEVGAPCPAVDCAPGADCAPPEGCGKTTKACGPKEIECQTDASCPTDWRCLTFDETSCSGSGSTGSGSTTTPPSGGGGDTPVPAPAPSGGGSKTLDDSSCTTTSRNLCVPRGYLAGLDSGGSSGDVKTATGASAPGYAENDDASNTSSSAPTYSAPQGTTANSTGGPGSSSDGCSTGGRGATGSGLLGALVVGLAAWAARRRR